MKTLLLGAAIGALLLPAALPAMAQDFSAQSDDHECVDEACTIVSLFQTAAPASGYQGTTAPKYGTWGFDLAGRDTSVNPGDSFMEYANGAALQSLQIPSDRTSYGSFALLRELSDNRMKELVTGLAARTDLTPGSDEQNAATFGSLMVPNICGTHSPTCSGVPLAASDAAANPVPRMASAMPASPQNISSKTTIMPSPEGSAVCSANNSIE